MNIKQLADMSGVNAETIRMYRKKGFLHPAQNPLNGYYDYTQEDYLNLLFIRKLRESGLSLNTIAYTYEHSHIGDVLGSYHEELKELDRQIAQLQQKRASLAVTLNHLEEYKWNAYDVTEIESADEKLDCYFDDYEDDPVFASWVRHAEFFTQVIGLKKEQLDTSLPLPEKIPVRIGLGTYRTIFEEQGFELPKKYVSCPPGRYVAAKVELEDLRAIRGEQLRPVIEYMRSRALRADSDSTAFLYRIDYSREKPVFIYRLRVKVIPDQGTPNQGTVI